MNNEFLNKIVEKSDLSEDEVKEKVNSKMKEFSGLVSEEGALHLVAKELEVQLAKEERNELKIENIVSGMRKVDLKAQVVDIGEVREFEKDDGSEGKVRNIRLGDETGIIRMPLWNDQTDLGDDLEEDQVIAIKNAYSREDNRGNTDLNIGKSTKIKKLEDEKISNIPKVSSGGNYKERDISEVNQENMRYKIRGGILQVYSKNPFYKSCPECGRKVKENEGKYECEDHGEVEPKNSMAISAVLDDGTDNIRAVFFRKNAKDILELDGESISEKEVEKASKKSLGKTIEVEGRSRYNDYFNRIEIISDNVKILNASDIIKKKIKNIGE